MANKRSCPLLISLFLLGSINAAQTWSTEDLALLDTRLEDLQKAIYAQLFTTYDSTDVANGLSPKAQGTTAQGTLQNILQGATATNTLTQLQTDVAAVKTETATIVTDVAAVKTETASIVTNVAGVKTETAQIVTDVAAVKTETGQIKSATDLIGANDGSTDLSVFAQIAGINTAVGLAKTSADGAKTAAELLPPLIGVKYTAASGVQLEVPATGLYKEIKTNSEKIDAAQSSLNAQDGVLSTMDGKLLQSDTKHASIEAAFVNLYEDPQCPSEAEIKKVVTDAIPKPAADAAQHGIKATLLATLITFTAFA